MKQTKKYYTQKTRNSKSINLFYALLLTGLMLSCCLMQTGCANTRSLEIKINNQYHSNYSTQYGDLPLDLRIYSTKKFSKPSLYDYAAFWRQQAQKSKSSGHLIKAINLSPNKKLKIPIKYLATDHILIMLGHFYAPQQKKWFSTIELPKHPLWQRQSLIANITRDGIDLSYNYKSWIIH